MSFSGLCIGGPWDGQKRVSETGMITMWTAPPVSFDEAFDEEAAPDAPVKPEMSRYLWIEFGAGDGPAFVYMDAEKAAPRVVKR